MAEQAANAGSSLPLGKILLSKDTLFGFGVVTIVIALIVPLPAIILDLLLTLSITIGVVMLLTAIFNKDVLEFSIFPSLLLVTTVYRLALNVSTTRLILTGKGSSMKLIATFGDFVVGGNYIVGMVIFLILVLIQFMVITKGSERVSEVTARFTLDAMPIKGMAIDADLNAGNIDAEEATRRRLKLHKEADFYGTMDGATKFVKGDSIAGLIITAINLIAGIAIGVIMRGEEPLDALKSYALYTVGDGLCSQLPALLISIATGILITRSASNTGMGEEVIKQLFNNDKVLGITSTMLFILALIPGLPKLPLILIGSLLGFLAYISNKTRKEELQKAAEMQKEKEEAAKPANEPEDVSSLLTVDELELEIGYNLIPLCDVNQGGDLLNRITMIRRQIAIDLGLVVPSIRIRDNIQIPPSYYVFKIKGSEYAQYEILPDHLLAMITGAVTANINGIQVKEPAYGLDALWIQPSLRDRAENAGYTVVDPSTVIATHLTEIIRSNAAEILGREELKKLLDKVKENYEALHDEVTKIVPIPVMLKILQNLLAEGVSIKFMPTILETLADCGNVKDINEVTEYVRQGLKRHICKPLTDPNGVLRVITLNPQLEQTLGNAMQNIGGTMQLALDPNATQMLLNSMASEIERVSKEGLTPIVLCNGVLRRNIKMISERIYPGLVVLSYQEIPNNVSVEAVGNITIQGN